MRAAIWLRVSTDMQVEGDSPMHHEKRARSYAEGKDWQVIEVYRLDAVSGKSVIDHPETKRMLTDIRSGHVKALIFSKLARLARNTRELLSFSDIFQECGANLVSLGESIDTSSPAGRLYFTLIAALTQWEREEIAARVAASVPIRAKLGKPLGGAAPFGYKWQEGKLLPDENEAPVRKLIYELWISERRLKAVARILNDRGYRTRNQSLFSDTTIRRLIADQTAKGVCLANYTSTKDSKKAWQLKPQSDWVRLPCEPIISEDIWQEANSLLSPTRPRKIGRPALHLFTGIVHCECGGKMYVPAKNTKYRCWSCNNKIPSSDLEALFQNELKSFFVDEAQVSERMLAIDEQIGEKVALLSNREQELSKLQKEIDRLHDLYNSEMIDKYGFGEKYRPLSERLEALNLEIPSLQGEIDAAKITRISREEIMSGAKDLYNLWPSFDQAQKRQIIENLVSEIIVGNDEIIITLLHTTSPKGGKKATRECRCGRATEPGYACKRAPNEKCIAQYQGRLSGPFLDRIDLAIEVPAVSASDLVLPPPAEGSAEVARRVARARDRQRERYAAMGLDNIFLNAATPPNVIEEVAKPDAQGQALIRDAAEKLRLTARGFHRVLKVARTIADLDGAKDVGRIHLAEALSYRAMHERIAA